METKYSIDIEPFRTILRMECNRDYANIAVIGGLDKFIVNWVKRNKNRLKSPQLATRFTSLKLDDCDYAGWSKSKRKLWVDAVLQFLVDLESTNSNNCETKKQKTTIAKRAIVTAIRPKDYANSSIDSTVTSLKGVKDNLATKLSKLGVKTIRDLIYLFPRRHLDYSQRKYIVDLQEEQEQTILANAWESRVVNLGGRRSTEVTLGDETGNIRAIWFNQPYLANKFSTNIKVVLSGKVTVFRGNKQFESPEWELLEDKDLIHTGRLVPVYPLTNGLYPRQLRNIIKRVIDGWANNIEDFLSPEIKRNSKLLDLSVALAQAHYPDNYLMVEEARKRLAFDELFLIQLGVLERKRKWQDGQPGNAFTIDSATVNSFLTSLPFSLTAAQKKAVEEIFSDLKQTKPMSRLLQGDVGSGKTIVAVAALLVAVHNGYQGALMAPTEILAEQHYNNICQLFSKISNKGEVEGSVSTFNDFISRPITFALLTSKINEKEKSRIYERICKGDISIVIGTHAIIQKGVEFRSLGLAIIDEQHRFGVLQRSALRQKGFNPHLLVMTATPIPRTLALTLYGDLDLSVIDELPPGRQTILTRWIKHENRNKAYDFIRSQVKNGNQAFIICPLIEESDKIEAKAAVAEYERLSQDIFQDLKIGLLHGRMPSEAKEDVMQQFRDGLLDILVSTPVVEVGIDVPNATVMLIEAADRFGLSQLHQFRGRVGRGDCQSYCLLLSERISIEAKDRLEAIVQISDGFLLAEKDLELRGPGEFFGVRQSGMPDLRMAKLSDTKMLESARNEAIKLFKDDPELKLPQHNKLKDEISRVWSSKGERS